MPRARFVAGLALGALGASCAFADQIVLQASKDNSIFSPGGGLQLSDGAGPSMFVGLTNSHGLRRALIAFDVSSIPANASVDSAFLSFNVASFHGFQTITLHRLLSDWGEGTSNAGEIGGAGAPAANGDATWDFHHYFTDGSSQPWNTPGGDFVADVSSQGTAAATTFVLDSTQRLVADVQLWRDTPTANFGWILVGDETLFGGADRLSSRENSDPTLRPTLTIQYSFAAPQWALDADGSWGVAANWGGTVPDSPTAVANLLGKITAPRTVTLDGDKTVAEVHFDSIHKYTIAPGTGGNLLMAGANGSITVSATTHEISAALVLASNTTMNVAGDGKLILSGGMRVNDGATLLMNGGGDVELGGPQPHESGSELVVSTVRLTLNSNTGVSATSEQAAVADLNVSVTGTSGVNPSLIKLNTSQDFRNLTIAFGDDGPQALDLNSTPTEFHAVRIYPTDLNTTKNTLAAAIKNGAIIGNDGLIDSGLHPGAAIGIAQVADAHGDPVILIRATRIGDLNLDGAVTISDFIDLASHFNSPGGWQEGDLNHDGVVTISDFIDLASNFNTAYAGEIFPNSAEDQATLNAFAQAHGVSLVPEPTVGVFILLAMGVLPRRRRRDNR